MAERLHEPTEFISYMLYPLILSDFVSLHTQVKNHIRQAKKWRDDMWPADEGGEGRPSSYLISLLAIKAFNIAKSTQ